MMGIGPSDAKALSMWEYSALLWNWNEARATDDDPVAPPDAEKVRRNMERLRNSPMSKAVH